LAAAYGVMLAVGWVLVASDIVPPWLRDLCLCCTACSIVI
jgi:hypothetical protein